MSKESLTLKIRGSKIIRACIYPVFLVYTGLLRLRYKKSRDASLIREMHNCYCGQRCFVIGNGPSLTTNDLEKLKNEISFGSNRIYNIFEFTDWRPTYYLCVDTNTLPFMLGEIKEKGSYPKFINYRAAKYGRTEKDNIYYLFLNGHFHINPRKPQTDSLSDDASEFLSKVSTVTVNAIELAIYMGFSKIYLLGVDNNYAKKIDEHGKIYYDPTVATSYFKGMRDAQGQLGDGVSLQYEKGMNYSYELAKKFAENRGVKIYNATRGGKLEIFERVNFDDLFKTKYVTKS